MEFHLCGEAALKDVLYLSKNNRILFTFFGILVTTKWSRAIEVFTNLFVDIVVISYWAMAKRILNQSARAQRMRSGGAG
jgi:hypothetical protein